MRVASPEFGPLTLIWLRVSIAALVLLPLLISRQELGLVLRNWSRFLFVGATTSAIPFTLLSYVALTVNAGTTSLLNATVAMFSAIVAWVWLNEKLTMIGIFGVSLGFVGVFIIASPESGENFQNLALPVLAAMVATCLYAFGVSYNRLYMKGFSSVTSAAGSQVFAALFMFPFGVWFWPETLPSAESWYSVIALGIFCTALALIMFFRLIKIIGVANSTSVAYLIPVFAIIWGAIFLGEDITPRMLIGGVFILLGVGLSSSRAAKQNQTLAK